jgi:hypothetical protein
MVWVRERTIPTERVQHIIVIIIIIRSSSSSSIGLVRCWTTEGSEYESR